MYKRHLLQIAVLIFSVILMGFSAWAVPGTINYQGRLTDQNGAALEGDYEMSFSLYNTGTGGSHIWNESQTVRITNGIYNVKLGAVNPLSIELFNDDTLYLEVKIDNEVLYPRDPLTSTAFSMRSGVADVAIDAGTVGGIQPGDLLDTSSNTQTKSGGLNISGRLGIGIDTPSGALHVNGKSILEGTLNIDTKQAGVTSLDQSQTNKQLTSFLDADWQSFTAGMEGILTRIEVLSVEDWPWGNTTLRIYEGEGTSGASLYERQYNIGITASDGIVVFDIPVESGPRLSLGSEYTLQIEDIDGLVWVEPNNPYAGGKSSFGADRDFWFKTYMRVGYNPGGVVAVTPDGNVGVGTQNPSAKLEVQGEVKSVINGTEFYMVPKGAIIMWSGKLTDIPAGWALCDGTDGTPDLRDRFIYGVSIGEDPGALGGAISHYHSYIDIPKHTHSAAISPNPHSHKVDHCEGYESYADGHKYADDCDRSNWDIFTTSSINLSVSIEETGEPSCATNSTNSLPPYYKMAYIIKL